MDSCTESAPKLIPWKVLAFKISLNFLSVPVLLARFTRRCSQTKLNFNGSPRSTSKAKKGFETY